MSSSSRSPSSPLALAAQVRDLFATRVHQVLQALTGELQTHLSDLLNEVSSPKEVQQRRDAWVAFPKCQALWIKQSIGAWCQAALGNSGGNSTSAAQLEGGLSLIEDDSVENKIMASRMALRIIDKVSWELNDLTVRMKALENIPELSKKDLLRPESLVTALIDEWSNAGMDRASWPLVQNKIQDFLGEQLLAVYKEANAFLIDRNVMKEIDLRQMVKRTPSGGGQTGFAPPSDSGASTLSGAVSTRPQPAGAAGGYPAPSSNTGGGSRHGGAGYAGGGAYPSSGSGGSGNMGGGGSGGGAYGDFDPSAPPMVPGAPSKRHFGFSVANLRNHAQNVFGGIKKVFTQRVGSPEFRLDHAPAPALSAQLMAQDDAPPLAQQALLQAVPYDEPPAGGYVAVHVQKAQAALREHSNALKKMTDEKAEKAIIELVALIFQNIIGEDRIAPGIRIWIARLQMPVLRLALEEPEFFESLDHPARKLIDHLGSCVLGFAGDTPSDELEHEIKRIVQVIEQYPETGKRVFELVYAEFKKFLEKHLANQSDAATRMVSLASQVEEKETLVIQYTIELRDQLGKLSLREGIRDFLLRTWPQVLAVATMKFGAKGEQTLQFKQLTPDLIWAAGAKPSRAERQKAIAEVPKIMTRVRAGMQLINCTEAEQTAAVENINATLTDAFMSKTEPIDQEVLAVLSERLANLEDYVTDEAMDDMPLDPESIELMLGIDTTGLNLITGEGAPEAGGAIKSWLQSLLLGSWHRIDHNGQIDRVQFCWRSAKGQLYLFISADGNAYLFQRRGLAAYLNAALLLPAEEEALTVLATREALTKLEANPERMTA